MGNLGVAELLVILALALFVIGPRRLPEVARGIGQAVRAFQETMRPMDGRSEHRERDGDQEPRGPV